MKIPQIIFREMTLEENINIIKWAYFENNESLDVHSLTLQYFPKLASIDNTLSQNEIYHIIEQIVTDKYDDNKEKIKEETKRYNDIWSKYNDVYFEALSKYLNMKWPENIKTIDASVGLIPVFPRYLESNSFALSTEVVEEEVIATAAHESLHFFWFKKWKELYPNCPIREYDSPHLVWQYSEMVTDPILNSKEINKVLNIEEKAYDSFYEIIDNNTLLMDNLKEIYLKDITIEEKIIEGFDYVKSVLENKSKKK